MALGLGLGVKGGERERKAGSNVLQLLPRVDVHRHGRLRLLALGLFQAARHVRLARPWVRVRVGVRVRVSVRVRVRIKS